MVAPLIPQEIYLLERYSSLEYFGRLRDAFATCVKAAEGALAEFMQHLPPDYRKRPLWQQPDAVWGERVIPNMQWAREGLNNGFIRISHGDLDALGMAGNVNTTFVGILRDYDWEWMSSMFLEPFEQQRSVAWQIASNISFTEQSDWQAGDLTSSYSDSRGPLDPPASWPQYRVNPNVRVKSDEKVPRDGIYLPDCDGACAQLLIKGHDASFATLQDSPDVDGTNRQPTTWTLVERIADSGGGVPGAEDPSVTGVRLRCEATHPCPREGYWFTPAKAGSRRHFKQGEIMPSLGGDYGLTIWQWGETQ
jgi:hypothetical protein